MPRDAGGNYTLPAGNPVVTGTVITSTWANPTMADIGNEITNSLSRDGQGGMRVPLNFFDGTKNDPGLTFTLETTAGIYRAGNGIVGVSASGTAIAWFKGLSGNVQTPESIAPIEDSDLAQKIWVEELVAAAVANSKPVGALEFGYDPNGVLAGTWEQLPEGTFLMNTVAGIDPAGGSNDAVNIEHNHPITDPTHAHGASSPPHSHTLSTFNLSSRGSTGSAGQAEGQSVKNTSAVAAAITVNANATGITVDNSGVVGTDLNKPKYVGVEVWQRTA